MENRPSAGRCGSTTVCGTYAATTAHEMIGQPGLTIVGFRRQKYYLEVSTSSTRWNHWGITLTEHHAQRPLMAGAWLRGDRTNKELITPKVCLGLLHQKAKLIRSS